MTELPLQDRAAPPGTSAFHRPTDWVLVLEYWAFMILVGALVGAIARAAGL